MSQFIFLKLLGFLKGRLGPKDKLLLAFSGGPDSTALLRLLCAIQQKMPFKLELAHVDHGQRAESSLEAETLRAVANELGLTFHLKKLESQGEGNLENYYREQRYTFFYQLWKERGYTALLLGHQQDDLEETVLKRFFEGAHLDKLYGIKEVSSYRGMPLWRPLLSHSKESILKWLEEQGYTYLLDKTNLDEAFLRARMRKTLIPSIEQSFGKNVRKNLTKHANSAELIEDYLKIKTASRVKTIEGKCGSYTDCSKEDLHLLEIQYIVRMLFHNKKVTLSFAELENISKHLKMKSTHKKWFIREFLTYVDRGGLFILPKKVVVHPLDPITLQIGTQSFGPWIVHVERSRKVKENKLGWERFFEEGANFFLQIPENEYKLAYPNRSKDSLYFKKSLSSWLLEHKVPAFLSPLIPVIQKDKNIFSEIITGKAPFMLQGEHLDVRFEYKTS
ncbi:MAG: tRNA(Ile)-lysidine synthase [Chlamydiae bacterium]|nr:tRNA(Ile)-lysidine synthase [Chlamydiota bacterium]